MRSFNRFQEDGGAKPNQAIRIQIVLPGPLSLKRLVIVILGLTSFHYLFWKWSMEYCIGMRTTMYAGRKVGRGDYALLSCGS